jgi:transcriptional regulator with XRE-family HTH domain
VHALRRFIQDEMDARGWQPMDLVRRSGLSKQLISNLLNDDRDVLPQLPRTATLAALAKAFDLTTGHVTAVAVQALGVADVQPPAVVHQVEAATDADLLRELLRRAEQKAGGGHARSSTAMRVPPPRSSAEVEERIEYVEGRLAALKGRRKSTQEAARPGLEGELVELRAELDRAREWERNRSTADRDGFVT